MTTTYPAIEHGAQAWLGVPTIPPSPWENTWQRITPWQEEQGQTFPSWTGQVAKGVWQGLPINPSWWKPVTEELKAEMPMFQKIWDITTGKKVEPMTLDPEKLAAAQAQLKEFGNQWVLPTLLFAALPSATATWAATKALPTAAKIAARVPLAPLYGMEQAPGAVIKGITKVIPKIAPVARELAVSEVGALGKERVPKLVPMPAGVKQNIFAMFGEGKPGLSSELPGLVYRNPSGKPIAAVTLSALPDGTIRVGSVVAEEKSLLLGKATKAITDELKNMKVVLPDISEMSPQGLKIAEKFVGKIPPVAETGFAGNIRLNKFQPYTQDLLKEYAKTDMAKIATYRRGTQTFNDTVTKADKLIENVTGGFSKRKWTPGQAYNAEEKIAVAQLLQGESNQIKLLTQEIAAGDNSAKTLLKLHQAQQNFGQLSAELMGVKAEAGRALSADRILIQKGILSGDAAKIQKLLSQYAPRDKMEAMATAFSKIDMDNLTQVAAVIRQFNKPKWWQYPMEIYINSLLSGIKTHVVNTATGLGNMIMAPAERGVAALIEAPLAAIQRRPRALFFSEVPDTVVGVIGGIEAGMKAGLQTLKTGRSTIAGVKAEYLPHAFPGLSGKIINFPVMAMEAEDTILYGMFYRSSLEVFAKREARTLGLKGTAFVEKWAELVSNPSIKLTEQAAADAVYRLFRQPAGTVISQLMKMRDRAPVLRLFIPFLRTPANLVKYGLERSPLGFFNPKLYKNLLTKSPEAAEQLARAISGSIIGAGLAWYAWQDKITGAAPTSVGERDRFYREGKQAYSIKIGDTWVSYQRLEPYNQLFSQVAAVVEAVNNKDDKDALTRAGEVVTSISKNFISQTYMSGLNDIINAVSEPEVYGARWLSKVIASGIIPYSSMTRTIAQAIDKTIRQPEGLVETIKSQIPGVSQEVPPRLNVFGEPTQRQTPFYSPINFTTEQETHLNAELSRLEVNIGFVGEDIGKLKLERNEQQEYQILAGQLVKQRILELIETPEYKELLPYEAKRTIQNTANQAKEDARRMYIQQSGITNPRPEDDPETKEARVDLGKVGSYFTIMDAIPDEQARQTISNVLRYIDPDLDVALILNGYATSPKTDASTTLLSQRRNGELNRLGTSFQSAGMDSLIKLITAYYSIDDKVWSQYPPEVKQVADQIEKLENTNPTLAKRVLQTHPYGLYILNARKLIAQLKQRVRDSKPEIDYILKTFY